MARPILIVAHPGHELRLFGWMERERPLVSILTDGSGSLAAARTGFSRSLIAGCGAVAGPVMGAMADRAWYGAILAGDLGPFAAVAAAIAAAAEPRAMVVADPVEGYNPMHDLCAAVADRVAALVGGARWSYPLMAAAIELSAQRATSQDGGTRLSLDAGEQGRKRAAIAAYTPLADEAAVLLAAVPAALAEEFIVPTRDEWPAMLSPVPEYERIGRGRAEAGVYTSVIGYAAHVAPLARRLRAG